MPFSVSPPQPERWESDECIVRPLVSGDAALDHEAVMASREQLRPWEQTGWPADDFTVEDNRADVVGLEADHRAGRRYTYTVLSPDGSQCLGCVYLVPPDAKLFAAERRTPVGGAAWHEVSAVVFYWVRTSRLADGLDRRLLAGVRTWLAEDWELADHLIVTNEQVDQQVELLASVGLQVQFVLRNPGQDGAFLAYGPGSPGQAGDRSAPSVPRQLP